MVTLTPGVFQVNDGEIVTIDVRSTGAPTLFGVNFSIFGGGTPLNEGQPLQIRMDKSRATGGSNIPNAKSTPLVLLFSFSSNNGGRYDWTVTGSNGGAPFQDFVRQAGSTAEAATYTFHIV
jgi:hypothetical protein